MRAPLRRLRVAANRCFKARPPCPPNLPTPPRSAAISSRTIRRSRCGTGRMCRDLRRRSMPAGPQRAAGAVPAHSVLPQALQVLLFPRLHRSECARRSNVMSKRSAREVEILSQKLRRHGSQAASSCISAAGTPSVSESRSSLRFLRDELQPLGVLGRCRRSHIRMRAGHAQPGKSADAEGHRRRRAFRWASKTSTMRSSKRTAGRTSRRKSGGPTTGFSRPAFRR